MNQKQKLLTLNEWWEAIDFTGPCVAPLRWLAIQCGFIQRLPNEWVLPESMFAAAVVHMTVPLTRIVSPR